MRRLAIFVVHRRWWVIIAAAILLPLAAFVAKDTAHHLSPTGYEDPGAESSRATQSITAQFPDAAQSDFVVIVTARNPGDVDAPEVVAAATALAERLGSAEGVASVNESAITGESAPVIRESGGDRSAVTGGTQVLSDWIVVRVTAEPGRSFLDRMIALVEGAVRQKTPNEIALTILLAGLTIVFLVAVVTLKPFAIYSGSDASVPGSVTSSSL